MKQILFLLLFPCLALAQYQGNENQKITLGEQTTADGLVYRGVAADTTRKPSVDTMAYILLDTNTNIIWQYKKATSNAWTRVGGSISSGVTGTLPVENGGTGQSTLTANKVMVGNGTSGVLTPTNLHWDNTNRRLGIGITSPETPLEVLRGNSSWVYFRDTITKGYFSIINGSTGSNITSPLFYLQGAGFFGSNQQSTAGFFAFKDSLSSENINDIVWEFDASKRKPTVTSLASAVAVTSGKTFLFSNRRTAQLSIMANGDVNIGSSLPTQKLDVNGNARIRSVGTDAASNSILYVTNTGVLSTNTSDVNKKHNIRNLPYGLSTINNLNPVAFDWNETDETDIGFIAQDIENVIPESVITNWDSQLIFRQEKIIPVLVKAIQEQNALIKALEQRILTLENK